MAEQRLVDVNNLGVGKADPDAFECKGYAHGWNNALQAVIESAPTIDPENLPVVRKLRELEKDLEGQLSHWKFWLGPMREHEAKTLRESRAAVNVMRKRCEKTIAELRAELARMTAERDDYKELFISYKHVCGGVDPQRIGELVEADKAGKAFIFPARPGDTVYQIKDKKIIPFHVGNIAAEEWGMSFEGYLEGIGPHRTGPGERVFITYREAMEALAVVLAKKRKNDFDYGGDRSGVI